MPKKMKKLLIPFLLVLLIFITSCQGNDEQSISVKEIETIEINSDDELVVTLTDGSEVNLGVVDGNDGQSAYEIYKQSNPNYEGSMEEWIDDYVTGSLIITINLILNGGTLPAGYEETLILNKGEELTLPTPTLNDYSFDGWYISSTYETAYDSSMTVSDDLTLYAKWILDDIQLPIELIEDREALLEGVDLDSVSSDLNLPTIGENGSQITWQSNKPEIISNDGKVFQSAEDEMVNLTATLTFNELTIEKTFSIKVIKGVTTIHFWHAFNGPNESAITQLTQQFNAQYEGQYQVVLTGQGNKENLKTAITAALRANKAPDLVSTYPDDVSSYMKEGHVVQALDEYIFDSEVGLNYDFTYQKYTLQDDGNYDIEDVTTNYFEDIIPAFRKESNGYASSEYLSLPLLKTTEVMYYNKTFFEENNLEVPETWDEVRAVAEEIKAMTVGKTVTITIGGTEKTLHFPNGQYSIGYDSLNNLAVTLFHQSGGGYTEYKEDGTIEYVFNNQTNIDALQMFKDLIDDGLATTPELADPYLRYLSDLFTNEAIYMQIASSGGSNYQNPQGRFEVGVAPIPQMADEAGNIINPSVIQQGPNITMLKQNTEAEREAAWEYIKFMTSTEASAYLASNSVYLPIRQSSFDSEEYQEYLHTKDEYSADPDALQIGGLTERVAFSQVNRFYVNAVDSTSHYALYQIEERMRDIIIYNVEIWVALEELYSQLTE